MDCFRNFCSCLRRFIFTPKRRYPDQSQGTWAKQPLSDIYLILKSRITTKKTTSDEGPMKETQKDKRRLNKGKPSLKRRGSMEHALKALDEKEEEKETKKAKKGWNKVKLSLKRLKSMGHAQKALDDKEEKEEETKKDKKGWNKVKLSLKRRKSMGHAQKALDDKEEKEEETRPTQSTSHVFGRIRRFSLPSRKSHSDEVLMERPVHLSQSRKSGVERCHSERYPTYPIRSKQMSPPHKSSDTSYFGSLSRHPGGSSKTACSSSSETSKAERSESSESLGLENDKRSSDKRAFHTSSVTSFFTPRPLRRSRNAPAASQSTDTEGYESSVFLGLENDKSSSDKRAFHTSSGTSFFEKLSPRPLRRSRKASAASSQSSNAERSGSSVSLGVESDKSSSGKRAFHTSSVTSPLGKFSPRPLRRSRKASSTSSQSSDVERSESRATRVPRAKGSSTRVPLHRF